MALFSERYGYLKPSKVLIREQLTPEICNAICSCFDKLQDNLRYVSAYDNPYQSIELFLWQYFLNQRLYDYHNYDVVATKYIQSLNHDWFRKLDLIEMTIKYIANHQNPQIRKKAVLFINSLNSEFERLCFAYRIVDNKIVEITDEQEIKAIEQSMSENADNIKQHLSKALEHYSDKTNPDYRNSIKESISSVEAFCREKTGEETLGKALNRLESSGLAIPKVLKDAFGKLYDYTNQPTTGIRHALMDESEKYMPTADEALFMIVSCSAFINYLNSKGK